jgi:hypothetical protein
VQVQVIDEEYDIWFLIPESKKLLEIRNAP